MKEFMSFYYLFVFLYIYAKQGQKQLFLRLCATVVYVVSRSQTRHLRSVNMALRMRNYGT